MDRRGAVSRREVPAQRPPCTGTQIVAVLEEADPGLQVGEPVAGRAGFPFALRVQGSSPVMLVIPPGTARHMLPPSVRVARRLAARPVPVASV